MTNPISEAASMVARGVDELQKENARLTELLSAKESNERRLEAEVSVLKEQLDAALDARDMYKGFSIEVSTQLNNVGHIIHDVIERAQQASIKDESKAYAPKPKELRQVDTPIPEGEKMPSFLNKENKAIRRV